MALEKAISLLWCSGIIDSDYNCYVVFVIQLILSNWHVYFLMFCWKEMAWKGEHLAFWFSTCKEKEEKKRGGWVRASEGVQWVREGRAREREQVRESNVWGSEGGQWVRSKQGQREQRVRRSKQARGRERERVNEGGREWRRDVCMCLLHQFWD